MHRRITSSACVAPEMMAPTELYCSITTAIICKTLLPMALAVLHGPTGMAYGPDGNLYVANASLGANDIVEFDGQTGAPLGTFATGLNGPTGLRYDSIDGNFYATNFGNFAGNTVSKINAAGTVLGNFGTGHALPTSIAIDPTGNVYIGEFGSGAVNKYAANGALLATGSVPATGGISFAAQRQIVSCQRRSGPHL